MFEMADFAGHLLTTDYLQNGQKMADSSNIF